MNATTNEGFAISRVYPGDLNALIKNLMKATGVTDANEVVRSINNGEWQLTKIAIAVKKVLKSIGGAVITFVERSTVEKFTFQTRDGLYVEEAVTHLLSKDIAIPTDTSVTLRKHGLILDANDTSITSELNPGYIFKEKENGQELLKQVIASCILAQWGGTEGVLVNNGCANIFYFERADGVRFTVYVYWDSGDRKWSVSLWGFGDREWLAGSVVFSRN